MGRLVVHCVTSISHTSNANITTCHGCGQAFKPGVEVATDEGPPRRMISLVEYVVEGDKHMAPTHHRCVGRLMDRWAADGVSVAARDGVRLPCATTAIKRERK